MNRFIDRYINRMWIPQSLLVATMLCSSCTSDATLYMEAWQDSKNYKQVDTESFSISVDLNNSHTVNPSVYGVNNSLVTASYYEDNSSFSEIYTQLGAPAYRFPGGTVGNYLNTLTGVYTPYENMETADPDWYATRITANNESLAKAKPGGVYDYTPMCDFLVQTGTDLCLLLNILGGMTDAEIRTFLEDLKDRGVYPKFIEMGNELYFSQYATPISDFAEYKSICMRLSVICRDIFPLAKIGLVVPSYIYTDEDFAGGSGSAGSSRERTWLAGLKPAAMGDDYSFFDSVIIHLYSVNGMSATTSESNYLSYADCYEIAMSHSDNLFIPTLEYLTEEFPGKTIWVTEYHLGGFTTNLSNFRMRYAYIGGLLNASNLLRLFKAPMVELGSWHSMVQWLEYTNPGDQILLSDPYDFTIKVNHTFFSMFNNAVNRSDKFVSATVNNIKKYTATLGANTGTYDDVDAGVFYNSSSKEYYVVVINKFGNSYSWDMSSLLESLPTNYGRVASVKALSPSLNYDVDEALALENASDSNQRSIAVSDDNTIDIDPYSMYVVYIN